MSRSPRWLLVAGLLVCLVAVVGSVLTEGDRVHPGSGARGPGGSTGAWVTSPTDGSRRLLSDDRQSSGAATATVRVATADRRQVWRGVGAAMTDASVELLGKAPDGVRRLFDPAATDGARLNWVRLPLTATDMSPTAWTWGWDGSKASPSPQAQQAAAMVTAVKKLRPDLSVVATPWTAAAFMKSPDGVRGGALRDDAVDSYGAMLLSQVDALRRSGVPLTALTLGNEPGYSADYPSMTMSDDQQGRLGRAVGPQLHDRGLQLWAVDHNWADRARYDAVLAAAPGAFDAAAFHCYRGRPADMAGVAAPPFVDECTGTSGSWREGFTWDTRHLLADSIGAGSTGLIMWNLAVDPSGGPRDLASRAGCASCRGLLRVDGDHVEPGPEFYVLAQLARAADPGAHVLGTTSSSGIVTVAFANADGTVGVLAHNETGRDRVLGIDVPGLPQLRRDLRSGEILTVRVKAPTG